MVGNVMKDHEIPVYHISHEIMESDLKLTGMRRRDRSMDSPEWIGDFLASAPVGTLATARGGQPFLNSNIFVYVPEKHCLYMHTAHIGRTRTNVEESGENAATRAGDAHAPGAPVCFSVHEMGRFLPADTALEMSVEYAGVVVFGRASVVENPDEALGAMQQLLDKYFAHLTPGADYHAITAKEMARTTVYRIDIDEWSGKQKTAADDFPGAFLWGELPGAGGA